MKQCGNQDTQQILHRIAFFNVPQAQITDQDRDCVSRHVHLRLKGAQCDIQPYAQESVCGLGFEQLGEQEENHQAVCHRDGLPIGAGLDDLGKGLRSMVGTTYGTAAKGARYLELTQGYITQLALNDNNEIIGFEFLNLGKFMEDVKAGKDANEAIKANTGRYGQWDAPAKTIDPRQE